MSYYKTMMTGNNKKKVKKVIKEKSKPKKTVLDGIKQELNEWHHQPPSEKRWSGAYSAKDGLTEHERQLKEVGAAHMYKKHLFNINKAQNNYENSIMDFKKFLIKQDNRSEAREMSSKFVTIVGKFTKWFDREIVRMIRKSI